MKCDQCDRDAIAVLCWPTSSTPQRMRACAACMANWSTLYRHTPAGLGLVVEPAKGHKCPRCWHWHRVEGNHDNLCDRCCAAILEGWPDHESVPHIRAAMARQQAKFAATQEKQP